MAQGKYTLCVCSNVFADDVLTKRDRDRDRERQRGYINEIVLVHVQTKVGVMLDAQTTCV